MRIVGGKLRGRPLATPQSQSIRPTTDRTRESLFNILGHKYREQLENGRVLDLFAGTGALGLEAMSRGARYAIFVEESVEGRGLIRQNVEDFGLSGCTKILRRDACQLGQAGTIEPFDMVFADPPYKRGLGERALLSAYQGGWLKPDTIIMLEEDAGAALELDPVFEIVDVRPYGDTIIRLINLSH